MARKGDVLNMGYCYTSGHKIRGRWRFIKCDGRSNKCAQDGGIVVNSAVDFPRCKDCNEWCKTFSTAVELVEHYERTHKDD